MDQELNIRELTDWQEIREPNPEYSSVRPKDVALEKDVKRPEDFAEAGKRNRRILVVDDDSRTREMLLKALSFMGYEAVAARNGIEAIDMFFGNIFDLVITDLQMPGMDGWSLAYNIKEKFPGTPVILMTAQAKAHVIKDIEKSYIDSALFKPFSLAELQHEIQRILTGKPNNASQ